MEVGFEANVFGYAETLSTFRLVKLEDESFLKPLDVELELVTLTEWLLITVSTYKPRRDLPPTTPHTVPLTYDIA